jgi:hypothetical protein
MALTLWKQIPYLFKSKVLGQSRRFWWDVKVGNEMVEGGGGGVK